MLRAALAAAGAVARRRTARASSDCVRTTPALYTTTRGKAWSIETEAGHTYKDPATIIDDAAITPEPGPSEFVQGLTLDEAGILLGVDANDADAMAPIYATALAIKQRIYANRIVLFAPLYIANYCVNSCRYCAFRCENKEIERSTLTHDQIRAEVAALERAGHRRLLVLTGEHPHYTFEQFLEALHVIADVRTEPCGEIRRMNVEIPSLSVSDMRRLKATNHVGTYTLFQETYHRETFKYMHVRGPKSDYDHRLLTHDRAMRGGLDDVGIGALFGLAPYEYEVLGMISHAAHLEREYGAGPHTISVPRMRHATGSTVADAPPHPVDDANFKKLVTILRIAVPYTGMILSTRESPAMRAELLAVGMSQMSAGSRTDVGAYARAPDADDANRLLGAELNGQFSLEDTRSMGEIVVDLLQHGFTPSLCTACYRKGRTGEAFMKIAKAGKIHDFCHPNSLLTLAEYLKDYGSAEEKEIGAKTIERESQGLTPGAARLVKRKLAVIEKGEHDVYV